MKIAIYSVLFLFISCKGNVTVTSVVEEKQSETEKAERKFASNDTLVGRWQLDSVTENNINVYTLDKSKLDVAELTGFVFEKNGDAKKLTVNSRFESEEVFGKYGISEDSLFVMPEGKKMVVYTFERRPKKMVWHLGGTAYFFSMYFEDSYEVIHGPGSIDKIN